MNRIYLFYLQYIYIYIYIYIKSNYIVYLYMVNNHISECLKIWDRNCTVTLCMNSDVYTKHEIARHRRSPPVAAMCTMHSNFYNLS